MPWIKSGVNRLIPSVIWQSRPQIPRSLSEMPKQGILLDIGAGGRKISSRVLGVDFIPFQNTSVVADIHNLPFAQGSVAGIFCTGTLEHVEKPWQAMDEMYRILTEGGLIHLEVPFMQPYHRDPVDYWRWTLEGLRLFSRQHGFVELRSGVHLGAQSAMNVLSIAYWQSWFHNRYIRKLIDLILSYLLFPMKYLDRWLSSKEDMPSAVFLVGRKSDE